MAYPNPFHFGVVVGIGRYPDEGINDLNFARSDARAFYDWLTDKNQGGVDPDNVAAVILSDEDLPQGMTRVDARPNQLIVMEAAKQIRKNAKTKITTMKRWEESRFYFFISGHGIAPTSRDAALLTANAGPEDFGNNVSSAAILRFLIEEQQFHELVFFADCCRERVEEAPLAGPPWTKVTGNNGEVVTCISYATYFGDLAHEPLPEEIGDDDARRGYFTRALLEGLRGQAIDANRPGEINSSSLARYVRTRVENLTDHLPKKQSPNMEADPGRPIVFRTGVPEAESREAATHDVDIVFTGGYTGRVILRDGEKTQVGQYEVAPGTMKSLALTNGFYELVPVNGADNVFINRGIFEILGEGPNEGRHRVEV